MLAKINKHAQFRVASCCISGIFPVGFLTENIKNLCSGQTKNPCNHWKTSNRKGLRLGTPGGTRTPDLAVRSRALYPAELQAHNA